MQSDVKVRLHHALLLPLHSTNKSVMIIGGAGLDALCRLDAGFAPYRESLFSQAATTISRDQQTQDTLAKIDEALQTFLCKLSNHFLAPGSFKALEYLIRRYK